LLCPLPLRVRAALTFNKHGRLAKGLDFFIVVLPRVKQVVVLRERLEDCLPLRHQAPRTPSIQVKFLELAMLGQDAAHRAGDRAHHHGLGLDDVPTELHTS
jgi:hypothetical protein